MEIKDIKKEKETIISLRKVAFKYITAYEEKSNHHCDLIENIKKTLVNKMNFTDSFKQTDNIFEKSAYEEISKMKETTQTQNQKFTRQKTTKLDRSKTLNEKVDEMNEFYEKLQNTVNGHNVDFVKTDEFQKFKQMNEKNLELKVEIFIKTKKNFLP